MGCGAPCWWYAVASWMFLISLLAGCAAHTVAVVKQSRREDARRSRVPHWGAILAISAYCLLRIVEFSIRIFANDAADGDSAGDSVALLFLFLAATSVQYVLYSGNLYLWWKVLRQMVPMGSVRGMKAAFVGFNIAQGTVFFLLWISSLHVEMEGADRAIVFSVASVLTALINLLVVGGFGFMAARFQRTFKLLFGEEPRRCSWLFSVAVPLDQIPLAVRAVVLLARLAMVSIVGLLGTTTVLVSDAVELVSKGRYPGFKGSSEDESFVFTHPVAVLLLYRMGEALPCIALLVVLRSLLRQQFADASHAHGFVTSMATVSDSDGGGGGRGRGDMLTGPPVEVFGTRENMPFSWSYRFGTSTQEAPFTMSTDEQPRFAMDRIHEADEADEVDEEEGVR